MRWRTNQRLTETSQCRSAGGRGRVGDQQTESDAGRGEHRVRRRRTRRRGAATGCASWPTSRRRGRRVACSGRASGSGGARPEPVRRTSRAWPTHDRGRQTRRVGSSIVGVSSPMLVLGVLLAAGAVAAGRGLVRAGRGGRRSTRARPAARCAPSASRSRSSEQAHARVRPAAPRPADRHRARARRSPSASWWSAAGPRRARARGPLATRPPLRIDRGVTNWAGHRTPPTCRPRC